jgi:hypothetical protein
VSEDPISFNGGDENLMRYVRNEFISFADSFGLWKISRTGLNYAYATSATGDTIDILAYQVGLNVNEWQEWLVPTKSPLMKTTGTAVTPIDKFAFLCPGQEVRIPNSILAIWLGDVGNVGRTLYFDLNVNDLKSLGFAVHTEITDQYTYSPTFPNPNPIIAALPSARFRQTATQFLEGPVGNKSQYAQEYIINRFQYGTEEKILHGIYVVGHGSPAGHGTLGGVHGGPGPLGNFYAGQFPIDIYYVNIIARMHYSLGAVVLQVCDGSAGHVLGGTNPGGIFFGIPGTYVPTVSFPDSIKTLWAGGRQGTN